MEGKVCLSREARNGLAILKRKRLRRLSSGTESKGLNTFKTMSRSGGDALRAPTACGVRIWENPELFPRFSNASSSKDAFSKHRVEKFNTRNLVWLDKIPECPVFWPSKDEFEDPLSYLHRIAPVASKFGIF